MIGATAYRMQSGAEDFSRLEARTSQSEGAQSLLIYHGERSSYFACGAALLLYASAMAAFVTATMQPWAPPVETPLELVMEPAAPAAAPPETVQPEPMQEAVQEPVPEETRVEDPALPEAVQTPPVQELAPPLAVEPEPVAPVEPPKPSPLKVDPKPVEKTRPKQAEIKPPVKKIPVAALHNPAPPIPAAAGGGSPPSNALASGYANLVHGRIARVAAYPHAAMARGENARVPYRIVIGPSGELVSKSITPSGNADFDRAAAEALNRAAPFPPSGAVKPVALSGAIVFRLK
jgi:protein TonB